MRSNPGQLCGLNEVNKEREVTIIIKCRKLQYLDDIIDAKQRYRRYRGNEI